MKHCIVSSDMDAQTVDALEEAYRARHTGDGLHGALKLRALADCNACVRPGARMRHASSCAAQVGLRNPHAHLLLAAVVSVEVTIRRRLCLHVACCSMHCCIMPLRLT